MSKQKPHKKRTDKKYKAFKFRIYPTKKQVGKLEWTLRRCKELYNASLQERRDSYRMCGVSVNFQMQERQLPDIKQIREEYRDIYAQVLQDVLRRVDKAMQAFFRRVLNGEKPGYPRFKSGDRYDSFTYPQDGYNIVRNRLVLSKIGSIKIKQHREIKGTIKTCTIKREGGQWYVVFTCEVEHDPSMTFHPSEEAVGIDLGIIHFAALSTGEMIDNQRFYRQAEEKLRKAHQKIARRKKGSHRRHRAKKELSRLYRKVRNRRADFLQKASRKLVNTYAVLVFEDLAVKNMTASPKPKKDEQTGQFLPNGAAAKGGLNKSILDAGWSTFVQLCTRKAEEAGGKVVLVDPKFTSQVCSGCGQVCQKELSERWHSCECGTELDRDHNAAINILAKYEGPGRGPQVPVPSCGEDPSACRSPRL